MSSNFSTHAEAPDPGSTSAKVAPRERRLLLAHAAGTSRANALTLSPDELDDAARIRYDALVAARAEGAPVAYLLGSREFRSREFVVDARVLIPRHETELLCEVALDALRAQPQADRSADVLDLGTGSGILAISIALDHPSARVVATDVSVDALEVARANARRLGADVEWREGSWYDALERKTRFDLVVSNPPYIASDDVHLAQGDLRFEPRTALTDGADGLQALATIVTKAPSHLRPAGRLAVEHGFDQGDAVRRLFRDAGFVDVSTVRDLAGLERVTAGRWPAGL